MSGGSYVIAGPEVDMTELNAVSSSPLAVDLNLNLGPTFALELALGGQDFGASLPLSRPSWPRFEPGILAGLQEDEGAPAMAEDPNLILPGRGSDARSFRPAMSRSALRGGRVDRDEGDALAQGLLQPFRNARNMRYARHPRQVVFAPLPDLVQPRDSSDHGSTTEGRALEVGNSVLPRNASEWTPGTFLEITPTHQPIREPNRVENSKKAEVGPLGAHFECNICLEMALEPVVTCCGHLFCWPCLYQWLHLHCVRKECPVCKGYLSDAAITPIYGRGSTERTDMATGNTPPRPHAHRVNGKTLWQERFALDAGISVGASMSAAQADGNEPEASNTEELVLNRLRVAQRLRRQYMFEVRQRLIGRRAALGPSSTLGATALNLSEQSPEQNHHENLLAWLALNPLETADSLGAVGNSMGGSRENLENMQRTVETLSAHSTQVDIPSSGEDADAGRSAEEDRAPPQETESPSPRHLTDAELRIETPGPSQASQRTLHRAPNEASSSADAEPGSLHTRKRRRLN